MNQLKDIHEKEVKLLEEKHGIVAYHNNELSKQLEDLEKTSRDIEANLNQEVISL